VNEWQRRTVYYSTVMVASMIGFTVVYRYGMTVYEGRPRTFLEALQFVVETYSTTGYGSDSPWETGIMNGIVIFMDTVGTLMIFLALPAVLFPALEDALTTTTPTGADGGLSDHVVIATYTPRVETLIAELESAGVGYVIAEPDRERAEALYEDGYDVIAADPETRDGLEAARLGAARALVADGNDREDASVVLTAGELDDSVRVVSVVEEPNRKRYHELAGADAVLSPRTLLGERLGRIADTTVTTEFGEGVAVGEDLRVVEVPIRRGGDLVGRTLAGAGVRERTGVDVIGAWLDGRFESPLSPDTTLESGAVLLAVGRDEQIVDLGRLTVADVREFTHGEAIVAGYGEVGRTVVDALAAAGVPYTVIDRVDDPGVDVVGDITDPATLREAGIDGAASVVLAVPDDTVAEFATLVIRDLNPDASVAVRVEEASAVAKTYRAGADYALSLAEVSGRMVASAVLDRDSVSVDTRIDIVRHSADGLTGRTLADAAVREETDCTVVAVQRNGDVLSDLEPSFRIRDGDELVVAGTDAGINRFVETFG
jgi:Trk K+ transport system NAD-binding subunit